MRVSTVAPLYPQNVGRVALAVLLDALNPTGPPQTSRVSDRRGSQQPAGPYRSLGASHPSLRPAKRSFFFEYIEVFYNRTRRTRPSAITPRSSMNRPFHETGEGHFADNRMGFLTVCDPPLSGESLPNQAPSRHPSWRTRTMGFCELRNSVEVSR